MERIKIKLYRILRNLGLERSHINLFTIFNEDLRFDEFDKACYLFYLESNFSISIPEKDIPRLRTIENTINYLHKRTMHFGGLN